MSGDESVEHIYYGAGHGDGHSDGGEWEFDGAYADVVWSWKYEGFVKTSFVCNYRRRIVIAL